jgi:hypothetical protein
VAVLAIALAVFLILLLAALAASTGSMDGASAELWGNAALVVLRAGVASGMIAAFGLAVTLLINSSVGSIVGFVIYWFIIENVLLRTFLPRVGAYLPVVNATAFVNGTPVERISGSVFSGDVDMVHDHSSTIAGLVVLVWVAFALATAIAFFQRRDID